MLNAFVFLFFNFGSKDSSKAHLQSIVLSIKQPWYCCYTILLSFPNACFLTASVEWINHPNICTPPLLSLSFFLAFFLFVCVISVQMGLLF